MLKVERHIPRTNFEIIAWTAEKPIQFDAVDKVRIVRLIDICTDEITLIDREIVECSIPSPKHVPQTRSESHVEVREVQPCGSAMSRRMALSRDATITVPGRAHSPWERAKRAGQLLLIALAVVGHSGSGPTVIIGSGVRARLLAAFLRLWGREVLEFESGYGNGSGWIVPAVLRRPNANSFLGWLSVDPLSRLKNARAIVFMDPFGAGEDFEALIGLERHAPPIVLPSAQVRGAAKSKPIGLGYTLIPAGASLNGFSTAQSVEWPKISMVTVSFNQAQYLEATLQSVLDQHYPNLEYIVVDGGSTDGSVEIIERYRHRLAHVIVEPDEGQSDALNKGFRLATGEIMNWLCSDDMIEPGTLARVGDVYRQWRPDIIVGGCIRIRETRSDEIFRHHNALPFGRLMPVPFDDLLQFMQSWQRGHYFFQPEVFFSRRVWEASGAFIKPYLYYAMDYDLWLRMAMGDATIMHVPDVFGCSRVHEAQKTQTDRLYLYQLRDIMKEYRDVLTRVSELI